MKCAVFPPSKDVLSMIRNRASIKGYELSCIFSLPEDEHWLTRMRDGGGLDLESVSDMDALAQKNVEALIMCLYSKTRYENDVYWRVIEEADARGIHVLLDCPLYTVLAQEEASRLASNMISKLPSCRALSVEYEKVIPIDVPVIMIMGLAPNVNKFDMQIDMGNYLRGEGYKVLQICSNSLGHILGMATIPDEVFDKRISFPLKTLIFNQYMYDLVAENNPDVAVVGIPNGIIPYSKNISNDFGEAALVISAAIQPDIGILMTEFTNFIDEQGIRKLEVLCRERFNTPLAAICISNNRIVENVAATDYDVFFLKSEFVQTLETQSTRADIPVVHYAYNHDVHEVFRRIINVLADNVDSCI